MNLQLMYSWAPVYRYYSSLSKNENMFKQSKLRKQKQNEKKNEIPSDGYIYRATVSKVKTNM